MFPTSLDKISILSRRVNVRNRLLFEPYFLFHLAVSRTGFMTEMCFIFLYFLLPCHFLPTIFPEIL